MCGIAGIIDFRGRDLPRDLLESLCTSLAHRGPDDRGIWEVRQDGFSAALAHTRLAVIDPRPDARQPMTDPAGRCAVCYNGELYNFEDLRSQLGGPWRTQCDTEVVLRACIEWGPPALQQFDAMWALAFIDAEGRTGHISRDPFGIKPLYYAVHDDRLVFASEMRTLCRFPDIPREIDRDALHLYLTLGFIPHPLTIYRHIRKLPPGHCLRFDAVGPGEPERFHFLPPPQAPVKPYVEACRQVRSLIEAAVVRQRVADVPLGAFLSGGLDSSVVVACLARAGGQPVRTFSIGYKDHARYDETQYAELVARHFGTEHHAFRLGFDDVLASIEPVLNHLGEPFADSSVLPTSLVSMHTRRHVTVALSGDGGDELFGGYWRYLGHRYIERYRRLPRLARRGVESLLRLAPTARSTPWLDRIRQVRKLLRGDRADPMARHLAWARIAEPVLTARLIGPDHARRTDAVLRDMYNAAPRRATHSAINAILLADLSVGLPADMLYKVDTASMLHSLEVRVPLLSPDLVDFVTGLPIEYKIQGTSGKRILKDAFKEVLPEPIVARRKMGFEVPIGEFLRNELRDMYRDVVTRDALSAFGINAAAASAACVDHLHRREDHTELLWALLVLCWWSRGAACP